MKKSILAGAGLLVLAGGAVATLKVADNKIEALYEKDELGMLHNFDSTESDLGFTGGTVKWTGDIVLDPCSPNSKITLSSTDTVSKSLKGYTISSEISPVSNDPEAMKLIDELPKMLVETQVNWSGNGSSAFRLPKHKYTTEDMTFSWSDFAGEFKFAKDNDVIKGRDLQFALDDIDFEAQGVAANLSDLSYNSNIPMGAVLESGEADFNIKSITFKEDKNNSEVNLDNLSVLVKQSVDSDTVGIDQTYKVNGFKVVLAGEEIALDDAAINFNLQGLSRPAIETMYAAVKKRSDQCVPPELLVEEMQAPVLELLKNGFKIQSKANSLKLGQGIASADIEMTIPESTYTTLEDAFMSIPSVAKYDATFAIDKAFIKTLSDIGSNKSEMISGSLEEDWQNLIQATGAKIEGDRAIIHKSN